MKTIRLGRRKQTKRDSSTFLYYRRTKGLPELYDRIVVVVAFRRMSLPESEEEVPNNFVVTAWGDVSTSPLEDQ